MPRNLNSGTIIAAAAIIYVIAMFLLDWDGTAVIIGALLVALVSVVAGRLVRQSR